MPSGDRKGMLALMRRIRETVGIRSCRFAQKTPGVEGPVHRLPYPRLILSVSGVKPLVFAEDGIVREVGMGPGEALFIGRYCWNITKWDQDHEKISLVLRDNSYLRFLYIRNRAADPHDVKEPPDCYYHVEDTVSRATIDLMHALEGFDPHEHAATPDLATRLLECLLDSATDDMRRSRSRIHGKATRTWTRVSHFLQDHYLEPVTRSGLARQFRITPQYVSTLFRRFADTSFSRYLNRLRVAHGAHLLSESDLTLDQIAWECGYRYTSYFIRVFEQQTGVSPTIYRRRGSPETKHADGHERGKTD